jgi:hypothetical protein
MVRSLSMQPKIVPHSRHSYRFAGTRLAKNDEAAVSLSHIGAAALAVAAVIISAVVALILLSSLFPSYSGAVGNLSENVTNADWGDPTANSISPTFGMLIALGGLFAIVGLAFVAYKLSR